MKIGIGVLLIMHGIIVSAQSGGSFGPAVPAGLQNPASLSWWPVNLGRSWLLSLLVLDGSLSIQRLAGLLWLVGGLALIASGLGLLGLIVPSQWWQSLAIAGAVVSLFMLAVYLHPLFTIGAISSITVLAALLWLRWPPELVGP
jgi:hypothetical protein